VVSISKFPTLTRTWLGVEFLVNHHGNCEIQTELILGWICLVIERMSAWSTAPDVAFSRDFPHGESESQV